ncbi:MAG: inositol monophosphatase family protein [Cyanobacteriota bacterium]|nr:inositol monophosphatase family protein [Cyanobacteriota bacterium]
METFWTQVLDVCHTQTQAVGAQLGSQFAQLSATRKADGTLVTEADHWSDEELRRRLGEAFPDHGFLTEETAHIFPGNDWCWVIDPIDGTTNFTWGLPIWGISLGLLYRGAPVFGFVDFPLLRQTYWGYWLGDSGLQGPQGAFCNSAVLKTSADEVTPNHLFNLCARSTALMAAPFPCKFRLLGVASYNILLVAAGAALGGTEKTPKIWDIAGAWPILLAAGGAFRFLNPDHQFPLQVGIDYGQIPLPCLTASSPRLLEHFAPFAETILD